MKELALRSHACVSRPRTATRSVAYGSQRVTVTADDGQGEPQSVSFDLAVSNALPELTLNAQIGLGTEANKATTDDAITVAGSFSDLGILDSHTVIIDWGEIADDASDAGTDRDQVELAATDARKFSFDHQYASGGIFTVTVTVIDDDGGVVSDSSTRLWVSGVRVDPNSETLQIVGTRGEDDVKLKSRVFSM